MKSVQYRPKITNLSLLTPIAVSGGPWTSSSQLAMPHFLICMRHSSTWLAQLHENRNPYTTSKITQAEKHFSCRALILQHPRIDEPRNDALRQQFDIWACHHRISLPSCWATMFCHSYIVENSWFNQSKAKTVTKQKEPRSLEIAQMQN